MSCHVMRCDAAKVDKNLVAALRRVAEGGGQRLQYDAKVRYLSASAHVSRLFLCLNTASLRRPPMRIEDSFPRHTVMMDMSAGINLVS